MFVPVDDVTIGTIQTMCSRAERCVHSLIRVRSINADISLSLSLSVSVTSGRTVTR
jgi:hypothetical protein